MTIPDLSDTHIGLDLDHTLFNPLIEVCDEVNRRYDTNYTPADITEYNFEIPESEGTLLGSIIMELHENPEFIRQMTPMPGAIETVTAVDAAGAEISIVTHREPSTFDWTIDALEANNIPYDHFIEDVPDNKADITADIDLLVDDLPDQALSMAETGRYGILMLRPYNVYEIPTHSNVHIPVTFQQRPIDLVDDPETQWQNIRDLIGELLGTDQAPRYHALGSE